MPEVSEGSNYYGLSWVEYKSVRQYQTMGDFLDECRAYGYNGGKEMITLVYERDENLSTRNGHLWLTKDPVAGG